jgi:hypothetical protein
LSGNRPLTSPSIVVTTVHGTFAHDATWVEEDSPFCSALREQVGVPTVFLPFRWSGGNTVEARLLAAEQLRAHLHRQLGEHPDANHFVIAHSHGGNAALYAMNDKSLQEQIAGIVCLSTPFVASHERKWTSQLRLCFSVATFMLPLALVVLGLVLFPAFWAGREALWVVAFIAVMFLTFTLDDRFRASNQRKLAEIRQSMTAASPPALSLGQALLVRGTGDEAAAALSTAHFVSYVTRKILTFLDQGFSRLSRGVDRAFKAIYQSKWTLLLIGGFIIQLLLTWLLPAVAEQVYAVIRYPFLVFGVLVLGWFGVIIAFGLFIALSLAVLGLLFRAYDQNSFYAGVFFDLSAEPSPPGQWVTYQMLPPNDDALLANDLRHSLYEHPSLPRLLDGWMRTRLRAEAA